MPWRDNVGKPFFLKPASETEGDHVQRSPDSWSKVHGFDSEGNFDQTGDSSGIAGESSNFAVVSAGDFSSFTPFAEPLSGTPDEIFSEPGSADETMKMFGLGAAASSSSSGAERSVGHLGATRLHSGAKVSDASFSQLMASAFEVPSSSDSLLLPWEKGFCKDLFSRDEAVNEKPFGRGADWVRLEDDQPGVEEMSERLQVLQEPGGALTGAIFEKVVLGMSDETFQQQRDAKLDLAVVKWHCVLSYYLLASTTGRQIAGVGDDCSAGSEARRIIRAVIGTKSPSTAISRASCLLRFLKWCTEQRASDENPFLEERIWNYVCNLQDSGASATSGASFLSACRYAHHVFGFSMSAVMDSRRIQGATELMFQEKRFLKQAKVLTVENVLWLHKQLNRDDVADYDKALYGYVLVAIYGRCRHSDLAFIEDVILDVVDSIGFCEIRTAFHKNSRSAVQKATLLPIVMPALGVDGKIWTHAVQSAFNRVGLTFEGYVGGPLLRPPSRSSSKSLCKRGITSTEITNLLRLCFDNGDHDVTSDSPRVSSHSLKATALSWAAKFGVSQPDQAILGRHSSMSCESSTVYSRDASIRAVSSLTEVITAIHQGRFHPDAPRSLYRVEPAMVQREDDGVKHEAAVVKEEPSSSAPFVDLTAVEPIEVVELTSSGSDFSDEDSSSDSSGLPPKKVQRKDQGSAPARRFFKHKKSGCVHYLDPIMDSCATQVFACGKNLSSSFLATLDKVGLCKLCKKQAIKRGAIHG